MGGTKTTYSTTTTYEPDKVRAAEIQAQKEVALKQIEGNNIKLRKEATIELIETNARFEQLIINSKVKGFKEVSLQLIEMAKEYNLLAEQRILILETASSNIVKTMNENYLDFKRQIDQDSARFMNDDLTNMLKKANEFEENSPAFNLYHKQIESFSSSFITNQSEFIKQVHKQQDRMLQSHEELKKSITEHTNKIVENRIKHLELAVGEQAERLVQIQSNPVRQIENDAKMIGMEEGK